MKTWQKVLLLVMAVLLAINLPIRLHDYRVQTEGEAWLQRARQAATPDMTFEQASGWLRESGFDDVNTWKEQGTGDNYMVMGYRQLTTGLPLIRGPLWLQLEFCFDTRKRFTGVRSDTMSIPWLTLDKNGRNAGK